MDLFLFSSIRYAILCVITRCLARTCPANIEVVLQWKTASLSEGYFKLSYILILLSFSSIIIIEHTFPINQPTYYDKMFKLKPSIVEIKYCMRKGRTLIWQQ